MNILIGMSISLLITTILIGLFPIGNVAFSVAATILGGNALLCLAFGIMANKLNK